MLPCAKGHSLHVVLCLLLSLTLAMLPLELTQSGAPAYQAQMCGFLPNTTKTRFSAADEVADSCGPRTRCYSNTILSVCLTYTAEVPQHMYKCVIPLAQPSLCPLFCTRPLRRSVELFGQQKGYGVVRGGCGVTAKLKSFEYRLCTLQLCGLRQHPSSVKWKH